MYLRNRIYATIILLLAFGLPTQAQGPSNLRRPRPLARGIADVQARIERNEKILNGLRVAVLGHFEQLGEILYEAYGNEKSPAHKILKIKDALKDVRDAYENGKTGQVDEAFGQLGQALLDFGSDPTFRWLSPYQKSISALNTGQQLTFETARLWTTLEEIKAYDEQVNRDTEISHSLEEKSAEIEARHTQDSGDSSPDVTLPTPDDSVVLTTPSRPDPSTLDDAILIARWLDLGNRAFKDKVEEENFYKKFPAYQKFRVVAETHSPRTEVEHKANPCWACPECSSPRDNLVCRGCCEGE
jgi:hypothetical protein